MRRLALVLAAYLPHLAEEALTGMHDDRVIATAFAPLSQLSARHSAYLVFQIMLALGLGMTLLFALGGKPRAFVLAVLAVGLMFEAHHVVRALVSFQYNSGLVTSLPMPFIGAALLTGLFTNPREVLS